MYPYHVRLRGGIRETGATPASVLPLNVPASRFRSGPLVGVSRVREESRNRVTRDHEHEEGPVPERNRPFCTSLELDLGGDTRFLRGGCLEHLVTLRSHLLVTTTFVPESSTEILGTPGRDGALIEQRRE